MKAKQPDHTPPLRRGRRGAIRPLVFVALLATAWLLAACNLFQPTPPAFPIPLATYVPMDWRYLTQDGDPLETQQVNIDADTEPEWLLFFYYDNVVDGSNGPVGGVIYDAQQNAVPYFPGVTAPVPYQPSPFLVPYRLLPDWRPGKGQGYLADNNVAWEETKLNPDAERADELVVYGYGPPGITRLSIFWWEGATNGYAVKHFQGSHHIATPESGPGSAAPVRKAITYDRMYDRSNLCMVSEHFRTGNSHDFQTTAPALQFCQGSVPAEPNYPEAVVLAWLLSGRTDLIEPGQAKVDQVRSVLPPENVGRVISLTYEGAAATATVSGNPTSYVIVDATVQTKAGAIAVFRYLLVEQRPPQVAQDTYWLIQGANPAF